MHGTEGRLTTSQTVKPNQLCAPAGVISDSGLIFVTHSEVSKGSGEETKRARDKKQSVDGN